MSLLGRAIYGDPSALAVNVPGIAPGDYIVDPTGAVPGVAFVVVSGGIKVRLYFASVPAPSVPDVITATLTTSGAGQRGVRLRVTNGGVAVPGAPVNVSFQANAAVVPTADAALKGAFLADAVEGLFLGQTDASGDVTFAFTGLAGTALSVVAATVGATVGTLVANITIP